MRLRQILADEPPTSEPMATEPGPLGLEQIFLHLDDRGFVPFHPALAEKFGHKAAIFVGMALYWTRHSLRKHPDRGGWFFMSLEQWKSAIGLTRSEQATVRETLIGAGVLEEMLIGRPAVLNYRLNVPALAKALSLPGKADKLTWDMASNWFRGCKVYYKPLADIAGTIAAGLYLAYLLQRHRECLKLGQLTNGFIPVGQDEISTALVLGSKVQRNARDRLKKAGLINESGLGGALVLLNFDAILLCLRGQSIKPLPRKSQLPATNVIPQPPAPAPERPVKPSLNLSGLSFAFTQGQLDLSSDRMASDRPRDLLLAFLQDDIAPVQPVDFRQVTPGALASPSNGLRNIDSGISSADSGLALDPFAHGTTGGPSSSFAVSCNLESSVFAETCKQEASVAAESCKLELPFPAAYIQRSSFKQTTTTSSVVGESHRGSSSSPSSIPEDLRHHRLAEGLIFPTWLHEGLHKSICRLLSKLPLSEQQHALDEMDGADRCLHQIVSPVAWFSGLVKKVLAGECVWAYAPRVAADRIAAAEQAEARKAQEAASLTAFQNWRVAAKQSASETSGAAAASFDKAAERAKLRDLRNATAVKIGRAKK